MENNERNRVLALLVYCAASQSDRGLLDNEQAVNVLRLINGEAIITADRIRSATDQFSKEIQRRLRSDGFVEPVPGLRAGRDRPGSWRITGDGMDKVRALLRDLPH